MVSTDSQSTTTAPYTMLSAPVRRQEVDAYARAYGLEAQRRLLRVALSIGTFGALAAGVIATMGGSEERVLAIVCFIGAAGLGIGALTLDRLYYEQVRLWRFARARGWHYSPKKKSVSYPGLIFTQGHSRFARHSITAPADGAVPPFEAGEFYYTTGSGKNSQRHSWVYVRVQMDRHLPHMVLDATSNNLRLFGATLVGLPQDFDTRQRLSLEGDFDSHFSLYAPKEYERDALYVFTPDLMAQLIDTSSSFDAEVIDDAVYFYCQKSIGSSTSLDTPAFMQQIVELVTTVGTRFDRRTDYYADERIGDRSLDIVATQGRRLKQGIPWGVLIVVLAAGLYMVIAGLYGGQ